MKNLNKKYIIIFLIIAFLMLRFFTFHFKNNVKIPEIINTEIPKVTENFVPEIKKDIPLFRFQTLYGGPTNVLDRRV